MSKYRKISTISRAETVNMGDLQVKQPLPQTQLQAIDPFLLLHHLGPLQFPGGHRPQEHGVPPHPHRGFEPVSFIYRGGVHHRDSQGNDSIILAGGVQWMTAGRGVVHSERPPREIVESGGEQEFIQLWVNLPTEFKNVLPRYQGLNKEQIPTIKSDDGLAEIQVVAGKFQHETGPILTHTPILALNGSLQKDASFECPIDPEFNAFVYLLDGRCQINEADEVDGENLVHFHTDGESVLLTALEPTRFLLMAGKPLQEPVVSSGPFVMNTHQEILEAIRDSQMGKMGVLIEEF